MAVTGLVEFFEVILYAQASEKLFSLFYGIFHSIIRDESSTILRG